MNPAIWFVDLKKVKIWKSTYWTLEIHSFWDEWEWLEIGNYCSIADGVKFILWGNHNYNNLTTFPIWIHYGIKWAKKKEDFTNWKIIIWDDVWIWTDAKIMSWVSIWQWAIIAAWSVVTKDVPPYAIYWWSPAKLIKYRFSEEKISVLKNIDYNKISPEMLIKNYDIITENLLNIEKIQKKFL
jgi:hypothetical protein